MRRRKLLARSIAGGIGALGMSTTAMGSSQSYSDRVEAQDDCDDCYLEVPTVIQHDPITLQDSGTFDSNPWHTQQSTNTGGGGTTEVTVSMGGGSGPSRIEAELSGAGYRPGSVAVGAMWNTFEVAEGGEYEFTINPSLDAEIETSYTPWAEDESYNENGQDENSKQRDQSEPDSSAVEPNVPLIVIPLAGIGISLVTLVITQSSRAGCFATGYAIQKLGGLEPDLLEYGTIDPMSQDDDGSWNFSTHESVTAELEPHETYRFIQCGGGGFTAVGLASVDVDYTMESDEVEYEKL